MYLKVTKIRFNKTYPFFFLNFVKMLLQNHINQGDILHFVLDGQIVEVIRQISETNVQKILL